MTKDELIFARRMLPHFLAGKSAEESAKAVIDDDARLLASLCDRSHSYYVATGEGHSATTRQGTGDAISAELTRHVYEAIRSS